MKLRYAITIRATHAARLAFLRAWPGVQLCVESESVWLCAEQLNEEQWDRCRQLPGAARFRVLDDGQLLPVGARVPKGRLPEGDWQPLAQWFELRLPQASCAKPAIGRVGLKLVRSADERPASLLLTDISRWVRHAATAPQVRLAKWSFAATAEGQVLIRGTPLPALPGERLVDYEGIVVPAGFYWSPQVDAATVRTLFNLDAGDVALWRSENWQRIRQSDWVQATRSAARLTYQELVRDDA